jgi:hypothetical protein
MILGPFIARVREAVPRNLDGFPSTGYCFQVADGNYLIEIPIYYDENHYFKGRRDLEAFFIDLEDLEFSVMCSANYHLKQIGNAITLIRFSPVFVALCNYFDVAPIESLRLLRDAAVQLQIDSSTDFFEPLSPKDGMLHPEAEALGFLLGKPSSYERSLMVEIHFRLRTLSDGTDIMVHGYQWRNRPTPEGQLGKIRFETPVLEKSSRLSDLYLHALIAQGITSSNLLTPAGREALIGRYEWTKLAKMTNAEAKEARMKVIAANPETWSDLDRLAEILVFENLYSRNTSRSQIKKALPKLIEEASSLK